MSAIGIGVAAIAAFFISFVFYALVPSGPAPRPEAAEPTPDRPAPWQIVIELLRDRRKRPDSGRTSRTCALGATARAADGLGRLGTGPCTQRRAPCRRLADQTSCYRRHRRRLRLTDLGTPTENRP